MGVFTLFGACRGSFERVPLRDLDAPDNSGERFVVVDCGALSFCLNAGLRWGAYESLRLRVDRFVQAFRDAGLRVVVIGDGLMEPAKGATKAERHQRRLQDADKALPCYPTATGGRAVYVGRVIRARLLALGVECRLAEREADFLAAETARDPACVGVFGNDGDFLMCDGVHALLNSKSFDPDAPERGVERLHVARVRGILAARVGFEPGAMSRAAQLLAATVVGNDQVAYHKPWVSVLAGYWLYRSNGRRAEQLIDMASLFVLEHGVDGAARKLSFNRKHIPDGAAGGAKLREARALTEDQFERGAGAALALPPGERWARVRADFCAMQVQTELPCLASDGLLFETILLERLDAPPVFPLVRELHHRVWALLGLRSVTYHFRDLGGMGSESWTSQSAAEEEEGRGLCAAIVDSGEEEELEARLPGEDCALLACAARWLVQQGVLGVEELRGALLPRPEWTAEGPEPVSKFHVAETRLIAALKALQPWADFVGRGWGLPLCERGYLEEGDERLGRVLEFAGA